MLSRLDPLWQNNLDPAHVVVTDKWCIIRIMDFYQLRLIGNGTDLESKLKTWIARYWAWDPWPQGYKTWVHSQTQNTAQWLAACGHMSASSQSLGFILSLRLYSGFITSRPGLLGLHHTCWERERERGGGRGGERGRKRDKQTDRHIERLR